MSNTSERRSPLGSCANTVLALIAVLAFLGFVTIYDLIPRAWVPRQLQPRSWREEQPYFDVDRTDLPLLMNEEFDNSSAAAQYANGNTITINDGRLRFFISQAYSGDSIELPGLYERFTLEFTVYPVGEIFDESVNILYHIQESREYEIRIRLRRNDLLAVKRESGIENELLIEGFRSERVVLGPLGTRIQLDVEDGEHILFINGVQVAVIKDLSSPFTRGKIEIGAGAGNWYNVSIEIDDVEIRGRPLN